ncbi:hypothetical protein C2845_PM07G35520 [Panicum miliaceum]|uniref:CBS domain-containing protein n=1 Tax=Panicum miliaceum TaxID=4540 RepID=A0A3L6SLY1_PANMI|nr:hypothetical protein C2845_PM07G35520 [Panicum miliaceum]
MDTRSASRSRRPPRRAPSPPPPAVANGKAAAAAKPTSPVHPSLERTVKKLRLTRALTLPEATTVSEACRRMAAKRVDAALLTDANGMLSGILTAEDIAGRVIAEGLKPEETSVVKVMTRNPVFVMSNSSAFDALQKMVQGKFRHLPVVERGEVIAMLDITKFLYDAISRMEMAAEQGSAIAAAMEGVERQWGNDFPGPHAFMESLREQMFKPSLSTIITENSSSKGLVLRVVAQNLPPETTLVEKVEGASGANDVANSMMQKFWDSALAMHPAEEFDARSDESRVVASESADGKRIHPPHYDDDEGDRVVLTTDSDLTAAIEHAKSAGWKVLRLHMDEAEARTESAVSRADPSTAQRGRPALRFGLVAGAAALAGVAVIVYLKRSQH